MNYGIAVRRFGRDAWLFMGAWALVGFAYFGVLNVLLNLYLLRLGYSVEFIGVLIGAGQLIWGICAFPAAAFGRRYGLRRSLVLAYALSGSGVALLVLVELIPPDLRPIWLLGTWALTWVGGALNTVSSLPYLAGLVDVECRNHAFAIRQVTVSMSGFLGSVIAGALPALIASRMGLTLTDTTPFRLALLLVPICFAVASVAMLASRSSLPAAQTPTTRRRSALPVGLLVMFGLVVVLETASEGPIRAFYNVYMDTALHQPPAAIGAVMGLGQLLPIVLVLLAPAIMTRLGSALTLALATLGIAAGLAVLAVPGSPHLAIAGYVIAMPAIAMAATVRAPFSQEIISVDLRPTTSAIVTVALALGWGLTALLGGSIIRYAGFNALFLISALLAVASATAAIAYFVRRSDRIQTAPS